MIRSLTTTNDMVTIMNLLLCHLGCVLLKKVQGALEQVIIKDDSVHCCIPRL